MSGNSNDKVLFPGFVFSTESFVSGVSFSFSFTVTLHFNVFPKTSAKEPKLSKKSISLCIGDSAKLQMKNAKKSATWKSKNKKIVSVNKKGKIKAKKSGSTKVIAKEFQKALKNISGYDILKTEKGSNRPQSG